MIFEWRTYQAADNAADAMKARFMKHTLRFFARHGITVKGVYSDPADPSKLYYLTQFETDDARQAAWKAFQSDPDWQAVKKDSETDGPLVSAQSTITLHPMTD